MKIKTGYLYHLKDEFFEKYQGLGLMNNHEFEHSRPSYLAIKDKDILWFIPLSTRIEKYQSLIQKKIKKYGECSTILIIEVSGYKQAVLIQNAFPTLEKYIKNIHTIKGKQVKIPLNVQNNILDALTQTLALKNHGTNLFFTDIDKMEEMIKNEINVSV